jgi:hypothetical protein
VIFTLAGCRRGECCVIERTEQAFSSRDEDTATANDWLRSTIGWEARVTPAAFFTRAWEEATARSRARRDALASWPQQFAVSDFAWVMPPILNPFTRVAVEMCPADGTLRVVGLERAQKDAPARPVTQIRELAAVRT